MISKIPERVVRVIDALYDQREKDIIEEWFSKGREFTSLRVNTILSQNSIIEQTLQALGFSYEKVSWLHHGYKLPWKEGKELVHTNLYENGHIYLQSLASQLVGEIMGYYIQELQNHGNIPLKILDIAASPWWKTSHISMILQNSGTIVACEKDPIRYKKLLYTLKKQNCNNVVPLNMDARTIHKKFLKGTFDCILADVPCSASWRILYKKEKTYGYLHKESVETYHVRLQRNLIDVSLPLLKKGGYFLYSTCSIFPSENEGMVDYILRRYSHMKMIDIVPFFKGNDLALYIKQGIQRFWKHTFTKKVECSIRMLPSSLFEGFFIALFRKS